MGHFVTKQDSSGGEEQTHDLHSEPGSRTMSPIAKVSFASVHLGASAAGAVGSPLGCLPHDEIHS